jgi:hypothetical protein
VGLTANDELKLRYAGLIKFYDKNVPAFKALAARAYSFAYDIVKGTGLPLRRDDVAGSLVDALELNQDLMTYLAENKLPQKFWYQRFADLILDRLWEDLQNEHK